MSIHKRRLCSRLPHQHGGGGGRGADGTVVQPLGLLVLFMGRAVTHTSLALFSTQTNTSSGLHALRPMAVKGVCVDFSSSCNCSKNTERNML